MSFRTARSAGEPELLRKRAAGASATAEIPYKTKEERLTAARNASHLWNIGKVLRPDPGE